MWSCRMYYGCTSPLIDGLVQEEGKKRYVGVPGMNSICKAMSLKAGKWKLCFLGRFITTFLMPMFLGNC